MTNASSFKAGLEAAAKLVECSVDQECCGHVVKQECCGNPNIYPHSLDEIAAAIRAIPVPRYEDEVTEFYKALYEAMIEAEEELLSDRAFTTLLKRAALADMKHMAEDEAAKALPTEKANG